MDVWRLAWMISQVGNQAKAGRRCQTAALLLLRATQMKTYSWGNAQAVLVGNKVDLEEERQVPVEDAQRLATELGQHTRTSEQHPCLFC